ncbi:TraR/DksA C4-type zinc finger protein [Neisseria sp. S1]|uniref:TraR/DksA C4-type zinc finger protein n=1 Tax=Neisseria sp. S1 TaxID=3318354 RepID=UPI003A8AF153
MTDIYDRAAEVEQLHREAAIRRQAEKTVGAAAVSAYECEECGELIPEARRLAVPGCRCCVECQEEIDKYGKTRFA